MTKEADRAKALQHYTSGYAQAIADMGLKNLNADITVPGLTDARHAFEKHWEWHNKESGNLKEIWEVDAELEELGLK